MSYIDLFKEISDTYNQSSFIKYENFSAYVCDDFTDKDSKTYVIPTKKIP